MKRALILIAAIVAFIVLTPPVLFVLWIWIVPMFHPPAPPLLQHVTAAGGWFGACPPRNEQEATERAKSGEALSPELNQRLARQFPPGSPEEVLVRSLAAQGFKPLEPCRDDGTIRRAHFSGPTHGALFAINAVVYWKTRNDTLVWTKGFVSFNGL
jgi:hypothetical protein